MGFELLLYILLLIGLLLFFIVISKTTLGVIPFLYLNARIAGRSNKLFKKTKWLSLSNIKNLKDFSSNLQGSKYELDSTITDLSEIHKKIDNKFLLELKEVITLSPKKIKPLLYTFEMAIEANIIVEIFRIKFFKEQKKVPTDVTTHLFTKRFIDKLNSCETIADLRVVFSTTKYRDVMEKKYINPLDFEINLDNVMLNEIKKVVSSTKIYDKKAIMNLIYSEYEITILNLLLKLVVREISESKKEAIVTDLNDDFKKIAQATTVEEFVKSASTSMYSQELKNAYKKYKKDHSLYHFEIDLKKSFYNKLQSNELLHYQGPYPILTYIYKLVNEKLNLYIVSKGIESGLQKSKIMEMVAC